MNNRNDNNPQPQVIHLSVTPFGSRVLILLSAFLLTQLLLKLIPDPLYIFEERLGTLSWQIQPETSPEQRLSIVAIDENSLQQYGPWPWSRSLLARLSDSLAEQGARLQIFDLVLPESKTGDTELQQSLLNNRALLGQVPLTPENLKGAGTAQQLGSPSHLVQSPSMAGANSCGPAPEASGFIANHSGFSQIPAGHIAASADSDGSIRFQPLGYCYLGRLYPSLALKAYQNLFQTDKLQWVPGQGLWQPPYRLIAPDYPLLDIPADSQGRVRISYHKSPDSFATYSAADLLNGTLPANSLRNQMVLIGATAFGLGDIVPTPHSGTTPGVELQARLLLSLMDSRPPYTPNGQWLFTLSLQLVSALLLLLLAQGAGRSGNRIARPLLLTAPVLFPLLMIGAHSLILQRYSLWLGWLAPALFAVNAALLLAALEYLRNRHERQRLYDNLSRYLPGDFARRTGLQQPQDQIEVEQKQVIVLSADLRNFSACQQYLPGEESARLLHQFFTQAGQLISQRGGTLYELHADSLLAIWPHDETSDTGKAAQENQSSDTFQQSIAAAQDLYSQLQPLLQRELPEPLSPLDLGIGLAAGGVTVGSLGCGGLRTHMLMGETVTVALRLQQMSAELASPILIDRSLAKTLSPDTVRSQGRYLLEGLSRPREIYTLAAKVSADTGSSPRIDTRVVPLRKPNLQ